MQEQSIKVPPPISKCDLKFNCQLSNKIIYAVCYKFPQINKLSFC